MLAASMFVAAALSVPSMPAPEYDDCEVVTNCVFDASRHDGRIFSIHMEVDTTPSNGVEVVFGRDVDGDGVLSRTEEALSVGYDCGVWKIADCATGNGTTCACAPGHAVLDLKLRLSSDGAASSLVATVNGQTAFASLDQSPSAFLFNREWNAAKVVRRGLDDPHPSVICAVDNDPLVLYIR